MQGFLSRRHVFAMLLSGVALVAASFLGTSAKASEPLKVVTTTGMIADAARQVGGDLVSVEALMGPGVDPHAYRQTRSDIVALTKADLVLWHGLYLEAQMEPFLQELEARKPVIAVGEAVPADLLIAHDEYPDKKDPHVWMDPLLWSQVVLSVRDAFIAARPEAKARFEQSAAAYVEELKALATYKQAVLASVPENARVLVTAHDAFNYFGQSYGFDVLGVQGISTESEAGLQRIAALVDLLVERDVGAVFVESSVSDRNVRALIEGAKARGHDVVIGGELFSDAMGKPGTYEGTYLGMIDHNATVISRALGGEAPSRGMSGALAAL